MGIKKAPNLGAFQYCNSKLTLRHFLIRNSQFLSTLTTTSSQYASTVFSSHSASETVLVSSLSY